MKFAITAAITLLLCGATLIVFDNVAYFSTWPIEYKLAVTGIILLIGLFFAIRGKKSTTASTTPTPPPKKPVASSYDNPLATIVGGLLFLAVVVGLLWYFVPSLNMLSKGLYSQPEPQKPVSPGPFVGHDFTTKPEAKFEELATLHTIHDVFYLEQNQMWKWDKMRGPIQYRILRTGEEAFTTLNPSSVVGRQWYAEYPGMLQVRSITREKNRIAVIRLNEFHQPQPSQP